jgi:hypothetical protein
VDRLCGRCTAAQSDFRAAIQTFTDGLPGGIGYGWFPEYHSVSGIAVQEAPLYKYIRNQNASGKIAYQKRTFLFLFLNFDLSLDFPGNW